MEQTYSQCAELDRQKMLLRAAAFFGDCRVENVEEIVREVLASKGGRPRSYLNNDGSPLQVCVCMTGSHPQVRLIGDPGADCLDPAARLEAGRQAVARS